MNNEQKAAILSEARARLVELEQQTAEFEKRGIASHEDALTRRLASMPPPEPPRDDAPRLDTVVPRSLIDYLGTYVEHRLGIERALVLRAVGEELGTLLDDLEEQINKTIDEKIGQLRGEMHVFRSCDKQRAGEVLDLPSLPDMRRRAG
jgi:hypothetical protein